MRTVAHMNTRVTLFPMPEMMHIECNTGPGERILQMVFRAVKKRNRIEYFRRQQRRRKKENR